MTKREQFLDILQSKDIAMLTNINESGSLVSHPMARNKNESDDFLWFFTRKDSEKVREIQKDPRVNVSFAEKDHLSISGKAEIVEDISMKKQFWTKANEVFFETEPEDANIVLLKIVMESAEYWKGENPVATAYQFVKGVISEEEPDMGKNEALDI